MDNDNELTILMQALDAFGIAVRDAPADSSGGLVRMHGEQTLFIGQNANTAERKKLCIAALKKQDLDKIHLSPLLRHMLGEEDWNGQ
jgi:hypothetical protein